jgi:DNA damage-binding protein 1
MRDSQSQDKCVVDPTGRFMALHLWEGVLTVARLHSRGRSLNQIDWMDQPRLSELFIKSSTFLYSETGHPKIAFLYQSQADDPDARLATYRLTSDDKDTKASNFDPLKDREISKKMADPGAAMLIPVPKVEQEKRHNFRLTETNNAKAYLGGVLVIGETHITYIDDTTQAEITEPLQEASIFVAWAPYDEVHYLVADEYGRMYLLTILTKEKSAEVDGLQMTVIGKTSRASCLVYMDNFLFVGSHYGDSQLWRVDFGRDSGRYLQLAQVFPNNAPILDFAIMDMGNREGNSQLGNAYSSGQARVVAGSGVHKDGSLRSIRSGVGLEDLGILGDLEGVRGLFSLRSSGSAKVDTLVASFITETRAFKFDPTGDVEELESLQGLTLDDHTLLAADLENGRRLQVTTSAALLCDRDSGMKVTSWVPTTHGSIITAASANSKWLLVCVDGKSVISLSVEKDLAVSGESHNSDQDQVACVHASPHLIDVGVIGYFTSGNFSLVDLATLEPQKGESLRKSEDNASIPRDIALVQVLPPKVGGPTLLVAMEDGNVVTYNVATDLSLSGRISVGLGTRQARFHLLPQSNQVTNIFATTENPSLIYEAEGRIVYSAVTAEDATYVCPFDTDAYPDSVAVATDSTIRISKIDTERRTHVKSLEMGETVRRIGYSPREQVFGLGCIKRDLKSGEEVVTSSFKLVDDVVFGRVGKPFLLDQAAGEIVESVIRATLPDSYGNPAERFLVGTGFLPPADEPLPADNNKGRLLVLGVDSDRNPYLLLSHKFKGTCRCLAVMDDMIVVSLTKTVIVAKYFEESSTSGRLERVASHRPSTYPVDLAVHGNIIAVADMMKSISLLEFVPAKDGNAALLTERARHYQSAWATAVCHIEDQTWLEADAQGNLMVLRRNPDGPTLDDQRRMETISEMNLGEMVNCIRKITVETSSSSMIVPQAFLGTVSYRDSGVTRMMTLTYS